MTTPQRPSEYELALRELRRQGLSEEDARKVFQVDPGSIQRLGAIGLEAWADEETAKAQAAFEQSDGGKRLAAQQLLAQELDIASRRKEAQALARSMGAPGVEELTDRELTGLTGLYIPTIDPPTASLSSMLRSTEPTQAEWDENLAAIERVSNGGEAA